MYKQSALTYRDSFQWKLVDLARDGARRIGVLGAQRLDAPGPVINDSEAIALAAVAGLGIAQLPSYLATEAIADGRLQVVLADYAIDRGDIWLVWPGGRMESPRVRVFAEFVAKLIPSI